MMRVSTYTVAVPLKRQPFYLLLNGMSGALDKVPEAIGQWLQQHQDAGNLPASMPVSEETLRRLAFRGHVTSLSDEAERALLIQTAAELHANGIEQALPSFSFIPSYVCQLRCPYCFQPHSIHKGHGEFGRILTNQQIADGFAIIDAMMHKGAFAKLVRSGEVRPGQQLEEHHCDDRTVGLFGGEPLTEHTRAAVATIAEQAGRRGMRVSAITNGVELHRFTDMLGPAPGQLVDLQVTFDGDRSVHDTRRVGPGHRATFAAIADNVGLALSKGVAVHARMNADRKNLDSLRSLVEFFEERGWVNDPRFDFHVAAVDGGRSRNEKLVTRAEVVERTTDLHKAGKSCVVSYENTARELLQRVLSSDNYPFGGTANCSAETGQLMFDPLGDVHSCWDEVGDRSRRIGTYDREGLQLHGPIAEQWLSRFPGAIEDCSRCPYALIHKSGCGSQARSASGSIFASDCKTFQTLFPKSLADAYEDVEDAALDASARATSLRSTPAPN